MSIVKSMRRQRAVYWPPLTDDLGNPQYDQFGQRRYGEPVEMRVRWEDTTEEFLDANQEKVLSNAKVYVDRDVAVGGFVRLGTLLSMDYAEDPRENSGVYEIRNFTKTPNLRNTETLRSIMV